MVIIIRTSVHVVLVLNGGDQEATLHSHLAIITTHLGEAIRLRTRHILLRDTRIIHLSNYHQETIMVGSKDRQQTCRGLLTRGVMTTMVGHHLHKHPCILVHPDLLWAHLLKQITIMDIPKAQITGSNRLPIHRLHHKVTVKAMANQGMTTRLPVNLASIHMEDKVLSLQLTLKAQPLTHRMGNRISIINLEHTTHHNKRRPMVNNPMVNLNSSRQAGQCRKLTLSMVLLLCPRLMMGIVTLVQPLVVMVSKVVNPCLRMFRPVDSSRHLVMLRLDPPPVMANIHNLDTMNKQLQMVQVMVTKVHRIQLMVHLLFNLPILNLLRFRLQFSPVMTNLSLKLVVM